VTVRIRNAARAAIAAARAVLIVAAVACAPQRPPGDIAPTASHAVPVYAIDPSFPRSSGVSFSAVSWVERDPRSNLIYVLQRTAPPVTAWRTDGTLASTWTTQALGDPHSISFHTGTDGQQTAWITDMAGPLLAGTEYGHCLKQFTMAGAPIGMVGTCGQTSQGTGLDPVQFDEVTDVAWNAAGSLIVSDGDLNGLNNRVITLDRGGKVLADWSAPGDKPGAGPKQFNLPHALLVDRCDRVWVADALNHRVQVIGSDGTFHGTITAFGDLGVYALAFGASYASPPSTILFAGASPTTGGGTGTVFLFDVPMDCAHRGSLGSGVPFGRFNVPIPSSSSMTLLHSITVDPETWDVYLTVLGGAGLPPQKWAASWPRR